MCKKRGFFIAIEGGDGLGKSTLINNLKSKFPSAVFTHEPGGNEFCESVRDLIMDNKNLSKTTEMYLFCASRAEFVDKIVLPNINSGNMVFTDRYIYSSLVYQGILAGLGVEDVLRVNEMAVRSVLPDLVICLVGNKSFRTCNENRFDEQSNSEAKIIYDGFVTISKMFDNFATIDVTDLSEKEVFERALKIISDKIN